MNELAESHTCTVCLRRLEPFGSPLSRAGGARRAAKASRAQAGEQVAGRPVTAMTAENVKKVRKLKEKGRAVAEIVKLTGISRASVYRALAG